jgi:hypothetical protein
MAYANIMAGMKYWMLTILGEKVPIRNITKNSNEEAMSMREYR